MKRGVLLPQDRFLLAAAAPDAISSEELAELATDDSVPWALALQLAHGNRLFGPAWALFSSLSLEQRIDKELTDAWRLAHHATVLRHAAARNQASRLFAAFADAGVGLLLYKGLDFSLRYYPENSPRTFADIDIIVRRPEIERADAALRAAGYELQRGGMPLAYYERFHLHAIYRHPDWPFPVELHWALDSPYADAHDTLESIFDSAVTNPELGPHVMRPSTLDALALMATHLRKHLMLAAELPTREARLKAVLDSGGLVWVLDIVLWMQREGGGYRAEPVQRRMRELDAEQSLATSLRLARDLHPQAVPAWAGALAARSSAKASLPCRVVYPDLSAGRGVTGAGERIRSLLLSPVPVLVFRPVKILEAIAASSDAQRSWWERTIRLLRIARLGAANLLWIARWRIRRAPRNHQSSSRRG
ncbi:MAG: nucleotidyltransferase family protein [Deltaproteobacteria bacterium]|nr:nucleotidyltransferase family protein [Deltaproteobacteria bacterium]